MKVRFTTDMNCYLAHLWSFFEDVEKLPLWVPGLQEFEITSPPPHGAGSTYVMKIKEGKSVYTYQGGNLIWDPRRRVKEEMWGGRMKDGQLMTVDYHFIDLGDRARLDYENDFQTGFWMGLVFMVAGRIYCKSMINMIRKHAEESALIFVGPGV